MCELCHSKLVYYYLFSPHRKLKSLVDVTGDRLFAMETIYHQRITEFELHLLDGSSPMGIDVVFSAKYFYILMYLLHSRITLTKLA